MLFLSITLSSGYFSREHCVASQLKSIFFLGTLISAVVLVCGGLRVQPFIILSIIKNKIDFEILKVKYIKNQSKAGADNLKNRI